MANIELCVICSDGRTHQSTQYELLPGQVYGEDYTTSFYSQNLFGALPDDGLDYEGRIIDCRVQGPIPVNNTLKRKTIEAFVRVNDFFKYGNKRTDSSGHEYHSRVEFSLPKLKSQVIDAYDCFYPINRSYVSSGLSTQIKVDIESTRITRSRAPNTRPYSDYGIFPHHHKPIVLYLTIQIRPQS